MLQNDFIQLINRAFDMSNEHSIGSQLNLELLILCVKDGILSLDRLLELVCDKPEAYKRTLSLFALLEQHELALDGAQKTHLLEKTLESIQLVPYFQSQAEFLIKLINHMPDELHMQLRADALAAIEKIEYRHSKVGAICQILAGFPQPQQAQLLEETIQSAYSIEKAGSRSQALCRIADLVSPAQAVAMLKDALVSIQLLEDKYRTYARRERLTKKDKISKVE